MGYFLAVDAGGTKAEFLLADELRELSRVTVSSIKRLNATAEDAERALNEATERLSALTGVNLDQVAYTCIGTSGNTVPLVTDWLRENFKRRIGGSLLILGDVEIALDAVFPGARGVLVLSGTGSNVAGRGEDGKIGTAGGWGPNLADQGAGYWIGLEALRRGFLAIDEGKTTELLEKARALWGLPTIKALIEVGNAEPKPRFADLTPLVVECADAGDAIAREILEKGGRDLAYLAGLVIERILSAEGARLGLPPVAIAGSVLGKIARVRETLMRALREKYRAIEFVVEPSDAVAGALYRARRGH
ncbi:MAG TPA: BadF/BadG/BcrA/BcrD ATPase family protein [Terracidiphilus sp.]|jgi:glucosamine kinase|nr:BadF/BadG/BcrA/BcrD ATPase family protein [Terracidiphilus sp.]